MMNEFQEWFDDNFIDREACNDHDNYKCMKKAWNAALNKLSKELPDRDLYVYNYSALEVKMRQSTIDDIEYTINYLKTDN